MSAYTEYQLDGTTVLSTRSMTYDGDNRVTAQTDITYVTVTYTSQITNDYRLPSGSTYTGRTRGL
ncbi:MULTISPECIES: hypothetical protein [Asticcacaulis]|uniref:hypothetical protein n=1 Tax=Asticcacaulis TaxID=76890 RepID=UPI001AE2E455|nr:MULTISPECIES: hypothetical protein [Asticcacaulis]MBP2161593.1 hypothetical protein [Asticcacaulis solisilvae]MDR6802638.1 hypothetical protein [Asticcacaulis sp. BE141]